MVSRKPKPQSYDARIFNIPQDETSTTMKDFSPLMCIDGNNWVQKRFSRGGATTKLEIFKKKSPTSPHSVGNFTTHSVSVPLVLRLPPNFRANFQHRKSLCKLQVCAQLCTYTLCGPNELWARFHTLLAHFDTL